MLAGYPYEVFRPVRAAWILTVCDGLCARSEFMVYRMSRVRPPLRGSVSRVKGTTRGLRSWFTIPVATTRQPLALAGSSGGHHRVMTSWFEIFQSTHL